MGTTQSCDEAVSRIINKETRLYEIETKEERDFILQKRKTVKRCQTRKEQCILPRTAGQRNGHQRSIGVIEKKSGYVVNATKRVKLQNPVRKQVQNMKIANKSR